MALIESRFTLEMSISLQMTFYSDRNDIFASLSKLQCTDLFGLCEFEDQSLVNDLLETDSEDEGKEEEAETLLKPEDLVTMGVGLRSRKPKTAKHQQNAIDPELQNIFLELESLQGSP